MYGRGGLSYLLFELQEYLMARSSVGACLGLKFYCLLSTSTPIFESPPPTLLRFACCSVVRFFATSRRSSSTHFFDSFSPAFYLYMYLRFYLLLRFWHFWFTWFTSISSYDSDAASEFNCRLNRRVYFADNIRRSIARLISWSL